MADITETLLDYCDCDGHGCEPCYAAEVIRRLRAEIERLREREQDLRMHAEQDACEIERLRAAGDALANVVKWAKWVSVGDDEHNALKAWQEARRG